MSTGAALLHVAMRNRHTVAVIRMSRITSASVSGRSPRIVLGTEPYGPDGKSTMILTSTGRIVVVLARSDLPKFASNDRTAGTPEENKAAVAGSLAYFGTYSVDEAGKMLLIHVDGSTFPNWTGTDQKRTIQLSGDEMKLINPNPSQGSGTATVTWTRVKASQPTASDETRN